MEKITKVQFYRFSCLWTSAVSTSISYQVRKRLGIVRSCTIKVFIFQWWIRSSYVLHWVWEGVCFCLQFFFFFECLFGNVCSDLKLVSRVYPQKFGEKYLGSELISGQNEIIKWRKWRISKHKWVWKQQEIHKIWYIGFRSPFDKRMIGKKPVSKSSVWCLGCAFSFFKSFSTN